MSEKTVPHKLRQYITRDEINKRVEQLAATITKDFVGREDETILLCVLKGAFVFTADLIRSMPISFQIEFCKASSYGCMLDSPGYVGIDLPMPEMYAGKYVLVVEDIVDTGVTMSQLTEKLYSLGAKKVIVCTLLSKPSRRKVEVTVHYIGFEVPDVFVVGYGLDYGQSYRNLDHFAVVVPTEPQ